MSPGPLNTPKASRRFAPFSPNLFSLRGRMGFLPPLECVFLSSLCVERPFSLSRACRKNGIASAGSILKLENGAGGGHSIL